MCKLHIRKSTYNNWVILSRKKQNGTLSVSEEKYFKSIDKMIMKRFCKYMNDWFGNK